MDGDKQVDADHLYYWCSSPETDEYAWFAFNSPESHGMYDVFSGGSAHKADHPSVGMLIRPVYIGDLKE